MINAQRKKIIAIGSLLVLTLLPSGPALGDTIKDASINSTDLKLVKSNRFKASDVGFLIKDLSTGEILTQHNANALFVPASTTKVFSSAYALEKLGADARFNTQLRKTGTVTDGVLKGNLIIVGGGDPFLTASNLFQMAIDLKSQGIKKIDGDFLYDESNLPGQHAIDPASELDQGFNPGVSALSVEFNRFFYWRSGRSRGTAKSQFDPIPQIPSFTLKKSNSNFPPGTDQTYQVNPGGEEWSFSTKKRYPRRNELPVRNPGKYTAEFFRFLANKVGIEIPGSKRANNKIESDLVTQIRSKSVLELSEAALEYSNNLFSELLLLQAAKKENEEVPDLMSAAQMLQAWVVKSTESKESSGIVLVNGSGLTAQNQVSPELMTEFLYRFAQRKYGEKSFWALLSISGWKGWIARRLHDNENSFSVWAKTGSMDYASSIAGVFFTKRNRPIAFSIFATDKEKRKKINPPLNSKSLKLKRAAAGWNAKAHVLQDKLLHHWITSY